MKITAPDKWLDDVDAEALRQWFIGRGFVPNGPNGRWLDRQNGTEWNSVWLPANLREFRDWKSRLIEAIEEAATLDGITAAEWFERERKSMQ